MSVTYNPINWQDGESGGTSLDATNLNHMEQGIIDVVNEQESLNNMINQAIVPAISNIDTKQNELDVKVATVESAVNGMSDYVLNTLAPSHNELNDYVHNTQDAKITNLESSAENTQTQIDNLREFVNVWYDAVYDEAHSKADRIENSASGHFLTLTDVSKSKDSPLSLTLYGKATQGGTSGKNLLDTNGLSEQTINGVTFTPAYENGMLQYININGTATSQARYSVKTIALGAGSYTLNGCIGGSSTTFRIITANIGSCYNGDVTGTLSAETSCNTSIIVESGATVNNIKIYPMLRLASVTDATYEPYTGGIASPNPDYPQEVTVAGADGNIVLTSCGKNLLSISEYTTNATGATNKNMDIPLLEQGKVYVLSGKATDGTAISGLNCQLTWWDADNTRVFASQQTMWNSGMVVNADLSKAVSFHIYTNAELAGKTVQIQLEKGTVATPYEAYRATTAIIPLANGLAGIPVESGGNYVDENGQQWVCDTLGFTASTGNGTIDSGYCVQRIKKLRLTSADAWKMATTNENNWFFLADVQNFAQIGTVNHYKTCGNAYCTHTVFRDNADELAKGNYYGFGLYYNTVSDYYRLAFSVESIQTLDDWKAFLDANEVYIYYPLAEQIDTSLTSEQLSAFNNIHIFHPTTNLFTDDIGDVGMGYVADTRLYIDRKFNELANAILQLS